MCVALCASWIRRRRRGSRAAERSAGDDDDDYQAVDEQEHRRDFDDAGNAFGLCARAGENLEDVGQVTEPISAVTEPRQLAVVTLIPSGGLAHDSAFYKNKIFGDPNSSTDYAVVDYLKGVSHDNFTYTRMNTTFVYEFTDPGTTVDAQAGVLSTDETSVKKLKRGLYLLGRATNLSVYDKNGDGVLKPSELTLLVVTSGTLGAARSFSADISSTLRYSGKGVSMGDRTAGNTFAHELTHTLGTDDVYGDPSSGSPCNSDRMTLMSCSFTEANEYWFGLDPWHLGQLGWDTRTESEKTSWAAGGRHGWSAVVSPTKYVKVESPTRNREYYVFEWRDRTSAWDIDAKTEGVIAWYVAETSDGGLLRIDSVTTTGQKDASDFVTAPTTGCLLDPWDKASRGRPGALRHGKSYQLKWRDKSISPALINVGPRESNGNVSIWSDTSQAGTPSCL
jgi:M6 family metalloprotease-like protein